MIRQPRVFGAIAATLLAVVFVVNIYRAATQSIVYDEAVTYLMFVGNSLGDPFMHYTANNHVLFSILASVTTRAFGTSEFTLRLPTVLAAAGYLWVVFAIARLVGGSGLLFVLVAGALSLNPLVLDFLSAARGYGLALFFWLFALLQVQRNLVDDTPRTRGWLAASLALGASVAANLAFLFPAVGLVIGASAAVLTTRPARLHPRELVTWLWLPGLVLCAAVIVVPLSHATREHFVFGADTLGETLSSLVSMSLAHHPTAWSMTSAARLFERILTLAIPVVLGVALFRSGILLAVTWATTLGLLIAAQVVFHMPYPAGRTGLYFIPLFIVTVATLTRSVPRGWATVTGSAVLLILIATSIEQFTLRSYTTWRYDAGSRVIAETMAAWPTDRPLTTAASQWLYQPALEYYRVVRFPNRLAPVADGLNPSHIDQFDFLVLSDKDAAAIDRSWRLIHTHPISGAHLFVNPRLAR
ncbi:MAG TPA: hypothetical protein VIT21_08170 [Chthoniobacterales bacterium]